MTKSSKSRYYFNPLEISFCGLSGSGKTTLIEKLAKIWRQKDFEFAYIKHDAHKFEMDKPGKDTARLAMAGALGTYINNDEKDAFLTFSPCVQQSPNCILFDFVVVEGYKMLNLPKIVVLDQKLEIKNHLQNQNQESILAYVGEFHGLDSMFDGKPYVHRDNIEAISNIVLNYFNTLTNSRPLYGLVLAGGRSRRMGHDKALLQYHNKNQLAHSVDLLSGHCSRVFYSARSEQLDNYSKLCSAEPITDSFLNFGPLGGILSALRAEPTASWLVTAIDLPALDSSTIKHLIDSKNPFKCATAYLSHDQQYIEPLCAIYEPKCYGILLSYLSIDVLCPTKILKTINTQLVQQVAQTNSLYNANTLLDFKNFGKLNRGLYDQYKCR